MDKPNNHEAKMSNPTEGPYQVLQVNNNGTLKIQRGAYAEVLNIYHLKPYFETVEQEMRQQVQGRHVNHAK